MPLRVEHLRHLGWQPYKVQSYQSWCGHTQETIPFPRADGSVRFIDVVGEASLSLFNGGAAVALLAYLGNVAGKGMPVPNMRLPMACYVVGLSACGLAFLFTYLTQFCLYNESIGNVKGGGHVKVQVVGIAFALLGLAAFSVGSCVAAWRF